MNSLKFVPVVDKVISLFEEVARVTEQTWDDRLATSLRVLFDSLFGQAKFMSHHEVDPPAAFPDWVLELLPLAFQLLMKLLSKK